MTEAIDLRDDSSQFPIQLQSLTFTNSNVMSSGPLAAKIELIKAKKGRQAWGFPQREV